MKTNLVRLFTQHGAIFVDTEELCQIGRRRFTIYTNRGNRLADMRAIYGHRKDSDPSTVVHFDNLFATKALADGNRKRINDDMSRRSIDKTLAHSIHA